MSTVVAPTASDRAQEYRKKLKLVTFENAAGSELPCRLIKEKTGVVLGRFQDKPAAERFLSDYPLAHLQSKPTRRRSR
ncbi:hypothetical protein [Xanthomonas phage RTH11]|nr:hypothetical protein [Xanthomonas phage RTH11]